MHETPQLNDPAVPPTPELLEATTGLAYGALSEFLGKVESPAFGFSPEWRFYKDGGAWLCKITHRKKTIAWLSVWPGSFKVGFYFTEKSGGGIAGLPIAAALKRSYRTGKPIGKLKPLTVPVSDPGALEDLYILLRYKSEIR